MEHLRHYRFTQFLLAAQRGRKAVMNKEPWVNFLAIGSIALPAVLYLGTGSLDLVAISMVILMMLQMLLLSINPDDPIGDKMREDARKKGLPPPPD
jgi:hypothetical protein